MVVVDTSIIIDHLRQPVGRDSLLLKLAREKPKEVLAVSVISVQELYEGRSTLQEEKEQALLATITPFKILPYTYETAKFAGQLARDLGHPVELADAAIAATTLLHRATLLTLNTKDFRSVPNLQLYHIGK